MRKFAIGIVDKSSFPNTAADQTTVQTVLNMVFVIIGALAFLMLVIAGVRYIVYGSDPAKITEVKKQIIYALVGIIVVALAATIVNFVLNRVSA
jgi:ABC-type Fe3+-siderophore transport system permease subunit